jgi:translation elongation factor P/translation initiation factor 5A
MKIIKCTIGDLKLGDYFKYGGEIWKITKIYRTFLHHHTRIKAETISQKDKIDFTLNPSFQRCSLIFASGSFDVAIEKIEL